MEALFNIPLTQKGKQKKGKQKGKVEVPDWIRNMLDADKVLSRFGPRVDARTVPTISGPSEAEFWYALYLFQKNWAQQFSSHVALTFMPELFPGMLMRLPSYKFQCYVNAVTHTFNFQAGGGFSTGVEVIAPSATDKSGFFGLPRAGAR
jgi:hypothetical protein